MTVLFWIVFDHFTTTFAPCSVSMTSHWANCLDGSKVEMKCGNMLEIRKSVKKANE